MAAKGKRKRGDAKLRLIVGGAADAPAPVDPAESGAPSGPKATRPTLESRPASRGERRVVRMARAEGPAPMPSPPQCGPAVRLLVIGALVVLAVALVWLATHRPAAVPSP
jgi:hypothetical protein